MLGMMQTQRVCDACGGKGKTVKEPCRQCRGSGRVKKQKTLEVSIPAGIDNGQRIVAGGQGSAGYEGGPNGDLYIQVAVRPHDIFTREGDNIRVDLTISFVEAALGAKITVPTLDGDVEMTVPEGTQTGTVFRLGGKGVPHIGRSGRNGRGDQLVTVTVDVPRNLSSAQKDALRKFGELLESKNQSKKRDFFKKKS